MNARARRYVTCLVLIPVSLILAAVLVASAGTESPQVIREKAPVVAAKPKMHAAITPMPRKEAWFMKRHEYINQRVKKGDIDMIFIGDSITGAWGGAGKAAWSKYYGKRKAANLGIGGDRTQEVLWRLNHGNIDGIQPKLAVILIGVNNSPGKAYSVAQIADGVSHIVALVRKKLPETKILLLGIFPYREHPCPDRGKSLQVNQIIRKLDDGRYVHYLDIGHHFIDAKGAISRDIMPDFLHFSPAGYELWASLMESKIAELMGDEPGGVAGSKAKAAK